MRVLTRLIVSSALLTLALAGLATASAGASQTSPVVGHLYVNDNTAAANTVAGFARHSDGSLTAAARARRSRRRRRHRSRRRLAGIATADAPTAASCSPSMPAATRSPCSASSPTARSMLVDTRRPPEASTPVSVAVHGALVYVANAGAGGSSYSGFVLGPFGRLHPLPGSTIALPDGSQPGDILFNSDGTKVAATRVGTSLHRQLPRPSDGRLAPAPGSPIAAQGLGPFGSEFRPTNPTPAVRVQRP